MPRTEWVNYWVTVNGHLIDEKHRVGMKGSVEKLNYLADNLERIPEVKSFEIKVRDYYHRGIVMERVFSEKSKKESD